MDFSYFLVVCVRFGFLCFICRIGLKGSIFWKIVDGIEDEGYFRGWGGVMCILVGVNKDIFVVEWVLG